MAGNTLGHTFQLTTFGESHGKAMGGVIDGCPAGVEINEEVIQKDLDRRRPGQSKLVSQRNEADQVELLSGIKNGKTLGTPIGFTLANQDARAKDYEHLKEAYRPSHADLTYEEKYGIRDHEGGGRASARETVSRVVGGAIAKAFLHPKGINFKVFVSQIGTIELTTPYFQLDLDQVDANEVRCPDRIKAREMEELIRKVRKEGDTVGGVITGVISDLPKGIGEPVFDKLHADLGKAMLSINAVKGFEIGSGFEGTRMKGSEHNDEFYSKEGNIRTRTNHSGGVQGGITNGEDIVFRVAFKPVATIIKPQKTVNRSGEEVEIEGKGRHDPCVLPRAVPIVEAMAALVMADHYLRQNIQQDEKEQKDLVS